MKTEELLCVGGPNDGKYLDNRYPRVTCPVLLKPVYQMSSLNPKRPDFVLETVEYTKRTFFDGIYRVSIFVPYNIPDGVAFQRLIEHYRPKEEE